MTTIRVDTRLIDHDLLPDGVLVAEIKRSLGTRGILTGPCSVTHKKQKSCFTIEALGNPGANEVATTVSTYLEEACGGSFEASVRRESTHHTA